MSKNIYLRYCYDAGHGWLRISRKDAEKLGILERISAYSYQSKAGNILYLEEDCDMPLVTEALKISREYLPCWSSPDRYEKRSRIRSLPSFRTSNLIG